MDNSLLSTKFYIPPARPGLVTRPRLLERLQAGLTSDLVLVSAPAGFGKTTLVNEWVHHIQPQVSSAWLHIDKGENDPIRFWDYFVATLRTLRPTLGETALVLLHSPQPSPIESVLTSLVNDLAPIECDFVLVLDDYHLIQSQPIHEGITFLLEHLPHKMHLVISTRIDPDLPLARFRAKGAMLQIGADDLRFTTQEAAGLFKQLQGRELSIEDIHAVNTRAEGWAAGLKMAALSLGQGKDVKKFIENFTGSQRYIMDYFVEEVLRQQTEEVQDFLLRTSMLERLTGPLCEFVAGCKDSQQMLVRLEQSNLFLMPLDESRQWYRYHHLFADLLQQQLEFRSGEEEVTQLHQRASQWYEDHNFVDNAVHHALTARDWERATRLIYGTSGARLKRDEWHTLITWLRMIPDDVLRAHPRLYGLYANALVHGGSLDAAEAALSYLETAAQADSGLQGEVALFQCVLARRRGDMLSAMALAEKALSLLSQDNLGMRAQASYFLGFVKYNRGLLMEAQRLLSDAYDMGRQAQAHMDLAGAGAYLGVTLWMQGKQSAAQEMVQQAIDLAAESPAAALPRSVMARILYERNDLKGSASNAQTSIEFCRLGGLAMVRMASCFWLARTRLAQGDATDAMSQIENIDQAARLPTVARDFRAYHAAWHVWVAIRREDLDSALRWGNQLQEYTDVLPFDSQHIPARLLIARGEKTAAAEQLKGLHQKAAQSGALSIVIQIRVCQALAADTPAEALSFLAEALKLGRSEGFVRTFVDEGKLLAPLLRQAILQRIEAEYAAQLLTTIGDEERQRHAREGIKTVSNSTANILSERELVILRLLEEGLSNPQIAGKLIISINTTKTHIRHVLEKLNADSRTQAISRARQLKLI